MAKTISQRISLEGSEELQQQLKALGVAGEQAFRQIQQAASKPIADPAQIAQTKQAVDALVVSSQRLAQQFQPLNDNIKQFGASGTQATQQVTAGLNQTSAAAQQAGATIQGAGQSAASAGQNAGRGLLSAAQVFGIAAAGIVAAMSAIASSLIQGTAETSKAVSDQADKLNLSIPQMQKLRTAIEGTSLASKKAGEVIGEDLAGSLKKVTDLVPKAQGQWAMLKGTLSQIAVEVAGGGFVTISSFGGRTLKDYVNNLGNESIRAATTLRSLGVSAETIAKGDTLQALREMALRIDGITNEAMKAREGNRAFGASWKEVTDALLQSMAPIDKSTASLAELGKMNRQLSEGDVGLGKAFLAQTADLSNALKAAKDQIGALFLGPATTKAKWLTDLVDGTAELFRQWTGLNEMQKKGFLAGLGAGPAQTAFKILVALGQQLAGIWSNVLVPAGRQLVAIVEQITGSLKGATTAQVTAAFVTLAIVAVGLATALKGIGVVLGPLAALFSAVFSPLGLILSAAALAAALFWNQMAAGANSVLAILPQQVAQVQRALQLLFAGDFSGAWALFKEAATTALEDIGRKLQTTKGLIGDFFRAFTGGVVETPWVATLVENIRKIGAELPGALGAVAGAFDTLVKGADKAASAINAIFGTELTGTGLLVIGMIAQFTGVLGLLGGAAILVGGALGIVANGLKIIGSLFTVVRVGAVAAAAYFGGLPVLIGLVIAALATLVIALVAFNWDSFKAAAGAAWDWIKQKAIAAKTAILDFFKISSAKAAVPAAPGAEVPGAVPTPPVADTTAATAPWDALKQKIAETQTAVLNFSTTLSSIAWFSVTAGVSAWSAIAFAVQDAAIAIQSLAISLSGIIWEGVLAGVSAWSAIAFAVQDAAAAISAFAASLSALVWEGVLAGIEPWTAIAFAVQQAAAAISAFAVSLSTLAWEGVLAGVEPWTAIAGAVQQASSTIQSFAANLTQLSWDTVKAGVSAWNRLTAAINRAINALLRFIALQARAGGGVGGGAGGLAGGGLMGGRGTGTSDSNLVWLSRGEHIMPARAVRQPGVLAFLEALRRSGGNLSRVLDHMGHFALGGLVPRPMAIPAFASGGLVGGSNVTIQFPGLPPIGGLRASSDVVDELRKAAAMAQVRSGGRKPSRYS